MKSNAILGRVLLAALLVPVLCAGALAKDVIELKSGEKVEGKLLDESQTEITILSGKNRLVLPKSMIKAMKIEEVTLVLSDGRELTGRIDKETETAVTLRMKLGAITINKMDIDETRRKVVERKPEIWERAKEGTAHSRRERPLKEVNLPKRTERLGWMKLQSILDEAEEYTRKKQYQKAIAKYRKILRSAPRSRVIYYRVAHLYALIGSKTNAVKYLRLAVAAGYTDYDSIACNRDFDCIRDHRGYREIMSKRDALQFDAAETQLEELRKQFGEGYTYEIDRERKLIFATNQSMEMLGRMKKHLLRVADAQWKMLWRNKPGYYITIVCPDRDAFRRAVANRGVAGLYYVGKKMLISSDIGQTLDHEFTHALHYADQDALGMRAPDYITEGFATLFESSTLAADRLVPRTVSSRLYYIREAVAKGKHKPWHTLRRMSDCQFMQEDVSLNYSQSRYMLLYLYNAGKLKKWYDNYCKTFGRDRTARIAWEMTFCKPLDEIEKDWSKWLLAIKYEMRKHVRWEGPYLGIDYENYEEAVILFKLAEGSPADAAGLREGDILTHAADRRIRNCNNLVDFLNAHEPGDKVQFRITRGEKELTIPVTLGKKPESE